LFFLPFLSSQSRPLSWWAPPFCHGPTHLCKLTSHLLYFCLHMAQMFAQPNELIVANFLRE
jgi:hypothetical protein